MSDFLLSFNATITAIGALLGGFAALLKVFPEIKEFLLRVFPRKKDKPKTSIKVNKMGKHRYTLLVVTFISLSYSVFVFAYQNIFAQQVTMNQKLTTAAWDNYNKQDFNKAIEKANECIKLFRGQAEIKQEELVKKNLPKPNTNPSKKEKDEIHSRGLLNDVATCYYIKGLCYQELGKKDEAISSFTKAEFYSYAMCWDPQGWFWNISEAASGKLRELKSP